MKTMDPIRKMFLICLAILLVSCSATNRLTMSVTEPAPITISNQIKRVGIINRFNPNSGSILNEIDKIFSAEGKHLDVDASNKVIYGLSNGLKDLNRFEVITIQDSTMVTDFTSKFPTALQWEDIDTLCNKYQVDAIYALSYFDTDSKITYSTKRILNKNVLGVTIPVLEHHATSNTLIKGGFRVYDPSVKLVLDVFPFSNTVSVTGKGINPVKAAETLKLRKGLILESSLKIGENYALSIEPYRIRVARDYFVKGTEQFEIGKRKAQTGDWNGAAVHWKSELNHPKSKIAGRACYNMAVINEINGNLDEAISWASKSYANYKNKDALRYLNILKYRKAQNQRLKEQKY